MPELSLHGVEYYYERAGSGEPLLLLHGFTGSSGGWRGVLPQLAARCETITVDLLGHGRTAVPLQPERYTMPHAAADLCLLLDKLEVDRAHLLGYSMGGRLALYLAHAQPERWRSLILESASPGLANAEARAARRAADERLAARILAEGLQPFVEAWEKLPLFASQERLGRSARRMLRAQRLQNTPLGLANSLRGMGTGSQPSLWENLDKLALPVLLLAGELDEKFVAINQQMAGLIPGAALHIIWRAGHTIHLEQPQAFATAVTRFLAGLETASPR